MRKLFIMLLMLGAVVSCSEKSTKEETKEPVKLDPYAKLYVNYQSVTKADENGHETAEYILAQSAFVGFKDTIDENENGARTDMGFKEESYNTFRDFDNNRFVFDGSYAVMSDREPAEPGSIFYWDDIVFLVGKLSGERVHPFEFATQPAQGYDTVAYIPNSVTLKMRADITKAMADGDFAKCHEIFNDGFAFIPITGEQYKALKAEGKN